MMHDVAVVGLGGLGLATLATLAARGLRTVGLEAARVGHVGAASRSTRGLRLAYPIADTVLVPLARRAHHAWRALEAHCRQPLLRHTGALQLGPRAHPAVQGVARSCARHGLPCELLEPHALAERFPMLALEPDEIGVLEHDAGILFADLCNRAHLERAQAAGATVLEGEPLVRLEPRDRGGLTTLLTGSGQRLRARHVVLACGAGLPRALDAIAGATARLPLQVEVQHEVYLEPRHRDRFAPPALLPLSRVAPQGGPTWSVMPQLAGHGLKLFAQPGQRAPGDPAAARAAARSALEHLLPQAERGARLLGSHANRATLTPDRLFLLGAHPELPEIVLAGGLSGHGFKFVPVLAELIAQLVGAAPGTSDHEADDAAALALFEPARFGTR